MKDPHNVFWVKREDPVLVAGAMTAVVPALKYKIQFIRLLVVNYRMRYPPSLNILLLNLAITLRPQ